LVCLRARVSNSKLYTGHIEREKMFTQDADENGKALRATKRRPKSRDAA